MTTNLDRFVEVWQASETAQEAARKLDMPAEKASNMATKLRNKGVPLKKFKARGFYNDELINRLKALALKGEKPLSPLERRGKALKNES